MTTVMPLDLNWEFENSMDEIARLSRVMEPVDPGRYQAEVTEAARKLKRGAGAIVASGHMGGLLLLSKLPTTISEILTAPQPKNLKEILANTLSDYFPCNLSQFALLAGMRLSDDLLVKAFQQSLAQDENPAHLCGFLRELPPNRFMECWLKVVTQMAPSTSNVDLDKICSPFFSLRWHVVDRSNAQEAAEFLAAHMEQMRPLLRHLLDNSKVKRPQLEVDGLAEEVAPAGIVSIGHMEQIKNALSFSGEFLFNLHAIVQDPLILELAEIGFSSPMGFRAYEFFAQLGLVRSNEWHHDEQVKSNDTKLVKLYEHAICTDGLKLDVTKVRHDHRITENPEVVKEYLELFRTVPLEKPDVLQKTQELLDAFVDHCRIHENDQMRTSLIEGRLPPILFAKHNKLLGQKFITELGV